MLRAMNWVQGSSGSASCFLQARATCVALLLAAASYRNGLFAQEQPAAKKWYESTDVNVFVSSTFSYNLNRPDDGRNHLRVFDAQDNSVDVDVLELSVKRDPVNPGETGFRFDLTAGSSVPKVARSSGLDIGDLDFHQMFLSYVVPAGRGLRIDIGKFITPLGYEVIEGYDGYNDNASRSFLFGYAIPFTHTGLRASYSFSDGVSGTILLVNGWDNAVDNNKSKTVCGQLSLKPKDGLSFSASGIYGPERDGNNSDTRLLVDLVGICSLSPLFTVGFNADVGREQHASQSGGTAVWKGVAGYIRSNVLDQLSLCLRAEQFEDRDGLRTGTAQKLREFTFTPEYRPATGFIVRGDIRLDRSTENVFMKRGGFTKTQTTFCLNVLFFC